MHSVHSVLPWVLYCLLYPHCWAGSYYGEKSIEYLFKGTSFVGGVRLGYKIVFICLVFVGSIGGLTLVWDIADTLNGLMALPNLIALVLLSGTVTKMIKEFFQEAKTQKD